MVTTHKQQKLSGKTASNNCKSSPEQQTEEAVIPSVPKDITTPKSTLHSPQEHSATTLVDSHKSSLCIKDFVALFESHPHTSKDSSSQPSGTHTQATKRSAAKPPQTAGENSPEQQTEEKALKAKKPKLANHNINRVKSQFKP